MFTLETKLFNRLGLTFTVIARLIKLLTQATEYSIDHHLMYMFPPKSPAQNDILFQET